MCVCVWVLYCLLSNACPPHSTQSLSLSVVEKGTITLAFFCLLFSVLPKHLSMSPTSACFPFSELLQMGEESYFEFLVII